MIGNVNKHVNTLESTLTFLRQQLASETAAHQLHHNTTDTNVATLVASTRDTEASIARLLDATRYLSQRLDEVASTRLVGFY